MQPWYALFEEPQTSYGRGFGPGWGSALAASKEPHGPALPPDWVVISPEFPERIIPWQAFLIAKGYGPFLGCDCITGEWNAGTAQATRMYAVHQVQPEHLKMPEGYVTQALLDHAANEDDYVTLAGDAERYQAECQAARATATECKKGELPPGALKAGLVVAGLLGVGLVLRKVRGA